MQTFLPYQNFIKSAEVLDKKRCWKQVVEAKQIILVLSHISECPQDKVPWSNHPAVKMWEGHTPLLKFYYNCFLKISKEKHNINTKLCRFEDLPFNVDTGTFDWIIKIIPKKEIPWWLGNEDFHRAMRSRLIEKDEAFYLPLFPNDKGFNEGKYFWPVMDGTKTFKII